MSSITTPHGTFSYEHDGYTVSESPDQNEYYVYLDDEQIGSIILSYHTSKGCSNRYGWVDVRGSRLDWTFSQFDAEIFPQMRTVRDRNGMILNKVHPSSAITAEFLPDRFHSIKQAFKFCVKKICEHLDSMKTVDSRQEMIDALVERDIESIMQSLAIDDTSFLDAVLRGDGWIPYNQLTDAQITDTFDEVVE